MQGAQAPQPRVGAFKWIAAAAALLVVLVGGLVLLCRDENGRSRRVRSHRAKNRRHPNSARSLISRQYAVTRSDQKQSDRPPLPLPRGRLSVTILLPVGSEPGSYEIQVLDSELKSRASATGQAEIRNYITTLQGTIDLQPACAWHVPACAASTRGRLAAVSRENRIAVVRSRIRFDSYEAHFFPPNLLRILHTRSSLLPPAMAG